MSTERALHEQGYALVVTDDDGEDYVYEDVVDFGPIWDDDEDEMTGMRVKEEAHNWLVFKPPPESMCLVRRDAL